MAKLLAYFSAFFTVIAENPLFVSADNDPIYCQGFSLAIFGHMIRSGKMIYDSNMGGMDSQSGCHCALSLLTKALKF